MNRAAAALAAGAITIFAVAAALWIGFDTPDAAAAPVECDGNTAWTVSNETELNAAIACYNAATAPADYAITLDADIASTLSFPTPIGPLASFTPIIQQAAGFSLTIDGAGHTLTANPAASMNVLGVATGATPVNLTNLTIAGAEQAGIVAQSGAVTVTNSTITNNNTGINVSDGAVTVTNSTITNNTGDGISVSDGTVTVTNSTITNNNTGINEFFGGTVTVTNSTITNNNTGIIVFDGTVTVTNSTITNNVAGIDDRFDATVTVASSIVNDYCEATDGGNNVGSCFGGPEVTLAPLADNGCVTPHATPTGPACVQTMALLPGSPALGAGTCTSVPLDQRGQPRTPVDVGCDAGAYEGFDCGAGPDFTVSTEADLDNAIQCYNAATTPVAYTITLDANIASTLTFPTPDADASFTPITQTGAGFSLNIDGNGNTLTANTAANTDGLNIATDTTPVDLTNLTITGATSAGIQVTGGTVTVTNSTITNNNIGIFVDGAGTATVTNSTITNTNIGIFVDGAGTATVTNSTITNNNIGIYAFAGAVTVTNSTIANNSFDIGVSGGGATVTSSIVNGCTGAVTDGGFNVGSCFGGPEVALAPLADNGCVTPHATPTGLACVQTMALLAASPALGAGTCTGVPLDQRGQPRTPVGDGCDAGAYEGFDCGAGPDFTVSTEADLDNAIQCYNIATAPAAYSISLAGPVGLSDSTTTVTQSGAGFSLTIDGNAKTLAGTGGTDGFTINASSDAPVAISNIVVSGHNNGVLILAGQVAVSDSTTTANDRGIRIDGGSVVVSNSTVFDNATGIDLNAGSVGVSSSSITNNRVRGMDIFGGLATVSNSTLANNALAGIGVFDRGTANVYNTTMTFNNEAINVASGGTAIAASSIVNGPCSSPPANGGSNVGSCFGGAPVALTALADNGCAAPHATPSGLACVRTMQLPPASLALGAGACGGVQLVDPATGTVSAGNLLVDQRGEARTPAGNTGCDAGAFEGFDCGAGPNFTVGTEADLDNAIYCYNIATTPAAYTITLDADIVSTLGFPTTPGSNASFTPITQTGAGFSLTIDGAGNTLTANPAANTDGLDIAAGTAPVEVTNLTIAAATRVGILVAGGTATVTNSTITNNTYGIIVDSGTVTVTNSTITNNPIGIYARSGGTVTVTNSTITNNTTFGIWVTDGTATVTNSTITNNTYGIGVDTGTATVTNSTITNNTTFGIVVVVGGTVTVTNSTITNNTDDGIRVDSGTATVTSSIANDCTGATDGGFNVGSCFGGDEVPVAALADNGCAVPHATPTGPACVQTMALLPASPALGAGTCTGVTVVDPTTGAVSTADLATDQRGQPRTPIGDGCDAGAYEAATFGLDLDLTVIGDAPASPWDFVLDGSAHCFVADLAATSLNLPLAAAGGATTVEVFDGCEVTLTPATAAGYTTVPAAAETFAMTEDRTRSFTATKDPVELSLTIAKTVIGDQNITSAFSITPSQGCTANPTTVSINGSGEETVTVTDIATVSAVPCSYVVTETPTAGYTVTPAATQTADPDTTVTFTNTQDPVETTLTIAKTVIGEQTISSAFTITPAEGCVAEPTTVSIDGSGEETITVTDIATTTAVPCTYQIDETPTDGYTVTPAARQTVDPGTRVTFTNTQDPVEGPLTIVKTVIGDQDITSTFTITTGEGCVADPATATITGSDRETITVTDIAIATAEPCSYDVTETAIDGYSAAPTTTQTALPGNTITFVNTQNPSDLELVIAKTVIGNQNITSTFTITPSEGCVADPTTVSIDGTGGETVTVTDIAETTAIACSYDVAEAPIEHYLAAPAATQTAQPGDTITFTNTQQPQLVELVIIADFGDGLAPTPQTANLLPAVVVDATDTTPVSQVFTANATAATATATFSVTPSEGCTTDQTEVEVPGSGSVTLNVTDVALDTATPCTYTIVANKVHNYLNDPAEVTITVGEIARFAYRLNPIIFWRPYTDDAAPAADATTDAVPVSVPAVTTAAAIPVTTSRPLAVTGTESRPLVALSLVLTGAGFAFLGLANRRRKQR